MALAAAAAAAAKSLQSCPTLCDPIDGSPPGSAVPGCRGQPQQDPGGTLRMNDVGERERRHMRLALIGPSLQERERERPDGGCRVWRSLAMLFYHSFYTLS